MCVLDFSNSKLSFDRSIWSYSKVQHLVAALIRGRRIFMDIKTEGLILDVGCGANSNPKNINLDYRWRPGVDICCDITCGLPLPNNYVAGIFSEHCIEHISLEHALTVFREMYRILCPRGHVRIIVPDLEIYIEQYKTRHPLLYANIDAAIGAYTPAMSLNRIMRLHEHRFIYDYETLRTLLDICGFVEINRRKFNDSADSALLLDTPEREIESLYVEACKR
jgi:predicted SAM-dependent methyltransferase